MADGRGRALRRDAVANRERLLDEAERVFAEQGIDASLHQLAAAAGVGTGTLYRNFPAREDLIRGVFDRQAERMSAVLERAAAIEDGWDAVVACIDGAVEALMRSPSALAVAVRMAAIDPDHGPGLDWQPVVLEITARAHAQGSLRPDVTAQDIAHIPTVLASLVRLPERVRGTVLARQRAIILDGLRADGARLPLPDAPLTPEEIHALAQGRIRDGGSG